MNSFFYLRSVLDSQAAAIFLSAGSEYLCGNVDHCPFVQGAPKNVQERWERLRSIAVAARQFVT